MQASMTQLDVDIICPMPRSYPEIVGRKLEFRNMVEENPIIIAPTAGVFVDCAWIALLIILNPPNNLPYSA